MDNTTKRLIQLYNQQISQMMHDMFSLQVEIEDKNAEIEKLKLALLEHSNKEIKE